MNNLLERLDTLTEGRYKLELDYVDAQWVAAAMLYMRDNSRAMESMKRTGRDKSELKDLAKRFEKLTGLRASV